MYKNEALDKTQTETLARLHNDGYLNVNKMHIVFFKHIYDFICRFADEYYDGKLITMSSGDVPKETMAICRSIGYWNLWKYFSPMEYDKRFYQFCKKLIKKGRISSVDYLAPGTIIAKEIEYEEVNYGR